MPPEILSNLNLKKIGLFAIGFFGLPNGVPEAGKEAFISWCEDKLGPQNRIRDNTAFNAAAWLLSNGILRTANGAFVATLGDNTLSNMYGGFQREGANILLDGLSHNFTLPQTTDLKDIAIAGGKDMLALVESVPWALHRAISAYSILMVPSIAKNIKNVFQDRRDQQERQSFIERVTQSYSAPTEGSEQYQLTDAEQRQLQGIYDLSQNIQGAIDESFKADDNNLETRLVFMIQEIYETTNPSTGYQGSFGLSISTYFLEEVVKEVYVERANQLHKLIDMKKMRNISDLYAILYKACPSGFPYSKGDYKLFMDATPKKIADSRSVILKNPLM